jgi:hypothetical protein
VAIDIGSETAEVPERISVTVRAVRLQAMAKTVAPDEP